LRHSGRLRVGEDSFTQFPNQSHGVCADSLSEENEFRCVETPFARFDLRDPTLRAAESIRDVGLRNAVAFARRSQKRNEELVLSRTPRRTTRV
jgi:hypothetical protein